MGFFSKQKKQELLGRHRPERPSVMTPPTFSYHTRRSQELGDVGRKVFRETFNAEAASRVTRYSLQRFGLLIVILVLFISLINISMLSPDNPSILPLDPKNAGWPQQPSVYQGAVQKLLNGSIANRNKLTIDTTALSQELERQFPELEVVEVKMPLIGHRPIIYLGFAEPVLTLETVSRSYVIDRDGRAIAHSLPNSHLVTLKDDSDLPVTLGRSVLASDTVTFIEAVLFQLQQRQLHVSSFELPQGRSELDAHLAGQGYLIKFNLADNTPEQQVGTFLAVFHSLQQQGITPAQYVDVRVEGRAYYK